MTEIVAVIAFALAWFVFRYERYSSWCRDVNAAHGALRAVQHGIVEGLTPEQAGWGQLYFKTIYTDGVTSARVLQTQQTIMAGGVDQVFVVPTEPLARLATARPQPGLIKVETVAAANFALWRVQAFNQVVELLTAFNARHIDEIMDPETSQQRKQTLAKAGSAISQMLHHDGIGYASAPGGWYLGLIGTVADNLSDLSAEMKRGLRKWYFAAWPFVVIDAVVVAGFVTVVVWTACH